MRPRRPRSRDAAAADILKQLAGAYFFDGYESDYIIKMRLRGGAPIATIQEKHLAWVENRDISFSWQFTQIPVGSTTALNDAHSATPSFLADVDQSGASAAPKASLAAR